MRRSGTKLDESRHLGGQIDYRVLVNLWLMAIGQLDDVEARPPPGVWPLSDDDGQPVPAGQPGHVLDQEQGLAMSEMEIVEQEHRARLLRRDDEELAHRHEPALTCRGQPPGEGSLEFGPASGRDRIKQSGGGTGHLRNEPVAPDLVEEFGFRHHALAMAQQIGQHVEDLGFNVDDLAAASQLDALDAQLAITESNPPQAQWCIADRTILKSWPTRSAAQPPGPARPA